MTRKIILGEGILETDFPLPERSRDPDAYVFDDIVALYSKRLGTTTEYPNSLIGKKGTLVAVMGTPRDLNEVTHGVRRHASIPPEGTRLVLGTGTVHIRNRTFSGDPGRGTNTAIGVKPALDEHAVRQLMCQHVTLHFEV